MVKSAFSHSSRWGVPGLLAGLVVASTVPACFGLSESDYNHDTSPAVGTSGSGGGAGTSSAAGTSGSATAGSLGSSGSVGNAGSVGSGGSANNGGSAGNGGSVANGGNAGSAGNGGSAAGQGGAGGQAGAMPVCPAKPADAAGTGLKGEYFTTQDLSGAVVLTRTDPNVDFDWGAGSPDASIPIDGFSARWTGQVQPRYTGTYTFSTTSDDGSRVLVDNKMVVEAFVDQSGMTENTGMIDLVAGMKYAIKVEYYEKAGGALIHVSWTSSCQAKEIVPKSQLFP
jgi:hypothetical protein